MSPKDLPDFSSLVLGLQVYAQLFLVGSEDQLQVLMLANQHFINCTVFTALHYVFQRMMCIVIYKQRCKDCWTIRLIVFNGNIDGHPHTLYKEIRLIHNIAKIECTHHCFEAYLQISYCSFLIF